MDLEPKVMHDAFKQNCTCRFDADLAVVPLMNRPGYRFVATRCTPCAITILPLTWMPGWI